ncbi:hypothetical protein VdG1_08866 [Verticillium dahliae VDG1]|nr:hypothetical protein VdG1_08866 [Verticillium dahliae VDG1]
MARLAASLLALSSLLGSGASAPANITSETVSVHWLGNAPNHTIGTTFGLPWPKGKYDAKKTDFTISGGSGESLPLESWVNAYWPDGSIKWSGHAIAASESPSSEYIVTASGFPASNSTCARRAKRAAQATALTVSESDDSVDVDTGKIAVSFPKKGSSIISSIETANGNTVGRNGKLVLHSQSAVNEDAQDRGKTAIDYHNFESDIHNVTVSEDNTVRTLVTVRGAHKASSGDSHVDWLPFVLRFYLYADSEAIRLVHTVIYDGKTDKDFISGLGIRFQVPLKGEEVYNRHVRLAGPDGGLLSEAVRGITGLRRDPGATVRTAQFEGQKTPDIGTWDTRVSSRMQWIPEWNDFSLSQLSPDGFTLRKRTKAGQSWVTIPGATRSGGLAYLGGATAGGLAISLRDFWKRHPTGLDIRNAAADEGEITLWLYSPEGSPLDLRPYHDGLGLDTYAKQLDALEITYEDWEQDLDTPYGIARSSEVFLFGFESTPSRDELSDLTTYINNPPVLVPKPETFHESGAVGSYWGLPDTSSPSAAVLEGHLDFLLDFYFKQVEQRRWYGFLDYGDVMHTYDVDRHQWRYDIGGYAWDNSELSPDLFIWLQFLRTGREDVYRFAEAMTRHTGEVDVYHIGPLKGLGTRHGIQHFGDSAKQARISTAQYRKYFYYVSGGDERIGEILEETLDVDQTYAKLDPNRKVRGDGVKPTETAAPIGLGTDFSGLAAGWLVEWERRGPRYEEALTKLTKVASGIAGLKNGFVSGSAIYNPTNGDLSPTPADPDNSGNVAISHLSSVFGLVEVMAELTDHWGSDAPEGFEQAWLDYCYYYSASNAEQAARYGTNFGRGNLVQAHSRLTAYASHKTDNSSLATRAWAEYNRDGLRANAPWASVRLEGSAVLHPIDEAAFVSTNDFSQYGLATIQNLALAREALP